MKEIIELRRKYSAVDLAKKLGVTRAMIYHYIDGKHDPSLRTYKKILEIIEEEQVDTDEPGGDFTGAGDWADNLTEGR